MLFLSATLLSCLLKLPYRLRVTWSPNSILTDWSPFCLLGMFCSFQRYFCFVLFFFPEGPPSNVSHFSELSLITCVNTAGQVHPRLIPPEPNVLQHCFLVPLIWVLNRVLPCFVIWFSHVCPVFPAGWKTRTGIGSSPFASPEGTLSACVASQNPCHF